jgi:hypothetical protein
MKREENQGIVILFGTDAKTIIEGKFRLLNLEDIKIANVGGSTNF